jgi:hypothetical protein
VVNEKDKVASEAPLSFVKNTAIEIQFQQLMLMKPENGKEKLGRYLNNVIPGGSPFQWLVMSCAVLSMEFWVVQEWCWRLGSRSKMA